MDNGLKTVPVRSRSRQQREKSMDTAKMGTSEGESSISSSRPETRSHFRSCHNSGVRSLRSRSITGDHHKRRGSLSPLPRMTDFVDMLPKRAKIARPKVTRPATSLGLPYKSAGVDDEETLTKASSMSFLMMDEDSDYVLRLSESSNSSPDLPRNKLNSSPESVKSEQRYPKAKNRKSQKKKERSEMFQMAKLSTLATNTSTQGEPTEPCTVDRYCWSCHRDGKHMIMCNACPRVFHLRCIDCTTLSSPNAADWGCTVCTSILEAETSNSNGSDRVSLEQLSHLFTYAIESMKECEGSEPFLRAVDTTVHKSYRCYIIYPMDLTLLAEKVHHKSYGSTEAFLADTKWILHNCTVFNTIQHSLTRVAKRLIRTCQAAMTAIKSCPDCYQRGFEDPDNFFIDICPTVHLPVWAKLTGFPYWPAKVMQVQDTIEVHFFGDHDRAYITSKDCFLFSRVTPAMHSAIRKPAQLDKFNDAMEEVSLYIANLEVKFGEFHYFEVRTPFHPDQLEKHLRTCIPNYNPAGNTTNGSIKVDIEKKKKDSVIYKTENEGTSCEPPVLSTTRKRKVGDKIRRPVYRSESAGTDTKSDVPTKNIKILALMDHKMTAELSPPPMPKSPEMALQWSETAFDNFTSTINIVNVMSIEKKDFDCADDSDEDQVEIVGHSDEEITATQTNVIQPKINVVNQSLLIESPKTDDVQEQGEINPKKDIEEQANIHNDNNMVWKQGCDKQNTVRIYPNCSLLKQRKQSEDVQTKGIIGTNSGPSPPKSRKINDGTVIENISALRTESPYSSVQKPPHHSPTATSVNQNTVSTEFNDITMKKTGIVGYESVTKSAANCSLQESREKYCDSPMITDGSEEGEGSEKKSSIPVVLKSPVKIRLSDRAGLATLSPTSNSKIVSDSEDINKSNVPPASKHVDSTQQIAEHGYSRISTDEIDDAGSSSEMESSEDTSQASISDVVSSNDKPSSITGDDSQRFQTVNQESGLQRRTSLSGEKVTNKAEEAFAEAAKAGVKNKVETQKSVSSSLRSVDVDDAYSLVPDPNAVDPLAPDNDCGDVLTVDPGKTPNAVRSEISCSSVSSSNSVNGGRSLLISTTNNSPRAEHMLEKTPMVCDVESSDEEAEGGRPIVDLMKEGPAEYVGYKSIEDESTTLSSKTIDKTASLASSSEVNTLGESSAMRTAHTETYLDPKTGEWRSLYLPSKSLQSDFPAKETIDSSTVMCLDGNVTISVHNEDDHRPKKSEQFFPSLNLGPSVNLSKGISMSVVKPMSSDNGNNGRKSPTSDVTLANLLSSPKQNSVPVRQTARKSFSPSLAFSPIAVASSSKVDNRRGSNASSTDSGRRNSTSLEQVGPSLTAGDSVPMVTIPAANDVVKGSGVSSFTSGSIRPIPMRKMLQPSASGIRQLKFSLQQVQRARVQRNQSEPHVPNSRSEPHVPNSRSEPHVPNSRLEPHVPNSRSEPHVPNSRSEPHVPSGRSGQRCPPDEWSSSIQQKVLQLIGSALEERAALDPVAEVLLLRKQLQKQAHYYSQEIKELKHNLALAYTESQASYKSALEQVRRDHQRTQEDMQRAFEKKYQEVERSIELAKKKQWCTVCGREAQLYCCWNTTYCDYHCQEVHWRDHMEVCRQKEVSPSEPETNNTMGATTQPRLVSPLRVPTPPCRSVNQYIMPRPNELSQQQQPQVIRVNVTSPPPVTPRLTILSNPRAAAPGRLLPNSLSGPPQPTTLAMQPQQIYCSRPTQVLRASSTSGTSAIAPGSGSAARIIKVSKPIQKIIRLGDRRFLMVEPKTIINNKNGSKVIGQPFKSITITPLPDSKNFVNVMTPSLSPMVSVSPSEVDASKKSVNKDNGVERDVPQPEVVSETSKQVVSDLKGNSNDIKGNVLTPSGNAASDKDTSVYSLEPTQLFGGYESPTSTDLDINNDKLFTNLDKCIYRVAKGLQPPPK